MFLRAVRAAEPMLKELSRRVLSPWKGNHVVHVRTTAAVRAESLPSSHGSLAVLMLVCIVADFVRQQGVKVSIHLDSETRWQFDALQSGRFAFTAGPA